MEQPFNSKHHEELIRQSFIGSVTVGERGQVVIPIEARHRLGLNAGDKLLVFVNPLNNGIFLIKPSALEELQRYMDLLKEMVEK
ncbi:AbrB/MazE/SpoVT family DNA-binding domain-containing protein [bacterium]|nr:AbrB/MazE/SpoVT family DNA-binding domain-containing protein [bacterium]